MPQAQQSGTTDAAAEEYPLSTSEYDDLLSLIKETTGIHLDADKHSMLRRRLSGRLRALGIDTFSEYADVLRTGNAAEIEHFANAITTNLTAFFREAHHFDFLGNELLSQLVGAARSSRKKLRIWCAGCSTGEEAFTIAMLIKEISPDASDIDIRILATDIDSDALARCAAGIYTDKDVSEISEERLHRWFSRGTGQNSGFVRIDPQLQELVTFRQLNLLHSWPMTGRFDIVFCRNVIIYFDKATQKTLVERFATVLQSGGYLFLGHSENLMNLTEQYSLLGKSVYRRSS